jgi:type VI secretion system protein ImpA
MPLAGNLLDPIPGPSPSGENLYYSSLYDKIKEARRQEEEIPQGEWRHDVKKADYPQVIKLATEALAKKSKDLQLAAWLTEAWLSQEGIAGLADGLDLLRGLIENFWESVYPELEDGDAEMRATPLEWVGTRLEEAVKRVPLTRSGLDWFSYKESRGVAYEAEAAGNETKSKAREAAIADRKLTPEEFDGAFDATPTEYCAGLQQELNRALESLEALNPLADEKFGGAAPGFGPLRTALEEVKQTLRILLAKRGAAAPAAGEAVQTAYGEPAEQAAPAWGAAQAEPTDQESAFQHVAAVARYLRKGSPNSPVPYLLLRGLRWGELRANPASLDESLLESPPTELRQKLKRLAQEGQWEEVLETAETAMGMSCGRAWLDVQRYVVKACEGLGSWYDPIALAVRAELKALLHDFPQLPSLTLSDDTPTANPDTQAWLKELLAPPVDELAAPPAAEEAIPEQAEGPRVADAYELAVQAMRSNRPQDALEIMSQEISKARSGRLRFQRKVQLAQVCIASGHEAVAYPILEELAKEVEQRNLEEWEAPDVLAHPLVLLLRAMNALDKSPEERQRIYARICRLDPLQALSIPK